MAEGSNQACIHCFAVLALPSSLDAEPEFTQSIFSLMPSWNQSSFNASANEKWGKLVCMECLRLFRKFSSSLRHWIQSNALTDVLLHTVTLLLTPLLNVMMRMTR